MLTVEKTLTGHDATTFSTSETRSVYRDLVVQQVNRYGVVNEAVYDIRGRIVTNKSAVGSDYE